MKMERGDIVIADFGSREDSSVQCGIRPAVVVSNNKANSYSPVITVVPMTTRVSKKRYLPTHVYVDRTEMCGLYQSGLALAEQVTSIDGKDILNVCGQVSPGVLRKITKAVGIQTGIYEL